MEILIFQTNIESEENVASMEPVFNSHNHILNWSIDLEDVDNVLRIETTNFLTESAVIEMVKEHNFTIETLVD